MKPRTITPNRRQDRRADKQTMDKAFAGRVPGAWSPVGDAAMTTYDARASETTENGGNGVGGKSVDGLKQFLQQASEYPLLTWDEERALAKRIHRPGADPAVVGSDAHTAAQTLVLHNIRLVVPIARWYARQGYDLDDLVSVGCVGLMKAATRYNGTYRFSTYATWWVRQAVDRDSVDTGAAVRIPAYIHTQLRTVRRMQASMALAAGDSEVSADAAMTALGMNALEQQTIRNALAVRAQPLSLEEPLSSQSSGVVGEETLGDRIPDPAPDVSDVVAHSVDLSAGAQAILDRAQRVLTDREYAVFMARTLEDPQPSLDDLGERLGVTRERIRQIEGQALAKLRRVFSSEATGTLAYLAAGAHVTKGATSVKSGGKAS